MPFQDSFFETVALPLADAFDAAERPPEARSCVPVDEDEMTAEGRLRALWTAQGVPIDEQNRLLAEVTAKAQPGAKVGPFTIPGKPHPCNCLHCGRGSGTMFCNSTCKTKWQSNMNAWHNRLPKTPCVGEQNLDFGE